MSMSYGVQDLEEHMRNILATEFIKKSTPVSTLIVAPPERNKSNTVIKFQGKTILTLNDLTAYGLMKKIEEHTKGGKCDFGHIIIPDLTRLTARGRSVRKELVATLQILMSEGIEAIQTYNIKVQFEKPLKIGVIACTTRQDIVDKRSIWSKIGFLSRFIPFSFNYDEQLKTDILEFINSDESLEQETIRIRKKKTRNVLIPSSIKNRLTNDARRMAYGIEEFCGTLPRDKVFGARALHQLTSYIKAIALRHEENKVTEQHYDLFKHLFSYFNYDCSLILPTQPRK
jgi:hypothetical protein